MHSQTNAEVRLQRALTAYTEFLKITKAPVEFTTKLGFVNVLRRVTAAQLDAWRPKRHAGCGGAGNSVSECMCEWCASVCLSIESLFASCAFLQDGVAPSFSSG